VKVFVSKEFCQKTWFQFWAFSKKLQQMAIFQQYLKNSEIGTMIHFCQKQYRLIKTQVLEQIKPTNCWNFLVFLITTTTSVKSGDI